MRFYDGADGLKTGHTDAAKYCLAATAKKDGMRLIAIVLGEENSKIRNSETMALLDYGFNTKKITVVKKKDKVVKELEFDKGDKEKIQLVPKYDVGVLENKASRGNKYKYNIKVDKIKLPIKQGDVLGKIIVKDGKKEITKVDLVSKTSIKKLNYIELYIETVKNSILGIIN